MFDDSKFDAFIKSSELNKDARTILQSPVIVLLGVSSEVVDLLQEFKISTVFDLATSRLFGDAEQITMASSSPSNIFNKYGMLRSDMLSNPQLDFNPSEAYLESLSILNGITDENRVLFQNLLSVTSVRDLAYWLPYRAAKKILGSTLIPESMVSFDPEAPTELVPKMGEFPTKKVFYSTLVLDKFNSSRSNLKELSSAIDLSELFGENTRAFSGISTGALITFEQAWTSEGLALGDLLHSLTLAPGESTKVAIVEWSRTEGTRTSEEISQIEKLNSAISRNRSIDDIATAVASEAQSGFSRSNSYASSSSKSEADSSTGFFGGFGFLGTGSQGSSKARASSQSRASSYASSNGRRDLFAKMTQNISDSTQQNSTSARHRYASIVQEISQSESEQLSTRVVTNYNHMHALTVQYFEVIQIHKVTTKVKDVERCLFVPITQINNWDNNLIKRYGYIIQAFALSEEVRRAITEKRDAVKIIPSHNQRKIYQELPFMNKMELVNPTKELIEIRNIVGDLVANTYFDPWVIDSEWILHDIGLQLVWADSPVSAEKFRVQLKNGEVIEGIPRQIREVRLDRIKSIDLVIDFSNFGAVPPPIVFPSLKFKLSDSQHFEYFVSAKLNSEISSENIGHYNLARFENTYSDYQLIEHLNKNTDYYSRILWYNMDLDSLASLLSKYSYNQRPLLEIIDLEPVAVTGNHIVFKAPSDWLEDESWRDFLIRKGYLESSSRNPGSQAVSANFSKPGDKKAEYGETEVLKKTPIVSQSVVGNTIYNVNSSKLISHDIIPLPSSGVFAEAVLGRFNSSEKLDLTRFWNWQDSPIPILPPEIASLHSESRAIDRGDVRPGSLDAPVVNIMNPPSLPDYQGLSPLLNAISTPDMFRDMSGQQYTASLAQSAMQQVTQAATQAAKQAGLNMETSAKLMSDIVKAVVPVVGGAMGIPTGGGSSSSFNKDAPGGKNISNAGAMVNHGSKLDQKQSTNTVIARDTPSNSPNTQSNPYNFDNQSSTSGQTPVYSRPSQNLSHEVGAFENVGGGYNQGYSPAGAEVTLAGFNSSPQDNVQQKSVIAEPPRSIEIAKEWISKAKQSPSQYQIEYRGHIYSTGDIYNGFMVIQPGLGYFLYLDHNNLLKNNSIENFLRDIQLEAYRTGVLRAEWMAEMAATEVEILIAILAPWYVSLGASVIDLTLKYYADRDIINAAIARLPDTIQKLKDIENKYPFFYKRMDKYSILNSFAGDTQGLITFIGDIVKNMIAERNASASIIGKITYKSFLKSLITQKIIPFVYKQTIQINQGQDISKVIDDFKKALKDHQINITDQEARELYNQMSSIDVDTFTSDIENIEKDLETIIPILDRLVDILGTISSEVVGKFI